MTQVKDFPPESGGALPNDNKTESKAPVRVELSRAETARREFLAQQQKEVKKEKEAMLQPKETKKEDKTEKLADDNKVNKEVKKNKKPGFKLGRKQIAITVIAVAVILFLGTMAFFLRPNVSMLPATDLDVGGGLVVTPIPSTPPTETQVPTVDWSQSSLAAVKVVEQSPMRNGVFQPKDSVLVVLMLVLIVTLIGNIGLDWREGGEGNEEWWEKSAVAFQSSSALIASILFPFIFSITYKMPLAFFMTACFFVMFMSFSIARMIKDGTPLNTGLVVLACLLAIRGVSEVPAGVAILAGWKEATGVWTGFYSWTGFLTLVVGLRTGEAALTGSIYLLLIASILVSTIEALKKYQPTEAVAAVAIAVVAVLVGNYLSVLFFNLTKPTTMDQVIAIEISKPVIGWALGVLMAIACSLALKGKEFKVRNITMQMAQVSGAQSIVNFIALMTTLSIVANLVWR